MSTHYYQSYDKENIAYSLMRYRYFSYKAASYHIRELPCLSAKQYNEIYYRLTSKELRTLDRFLNKKGF